MIKKLRLKNFLSYKDSTITFNEFNVIVGSNASGKSNLIKSLITLRNLVIGGFQSSEDFDPFLESIFRKGSPDTESLIIDVVIQNTVEAKLDRGGFVILENHFYTIELKYGVGIVKEIYRASVKGEVQPLNILERNEKQARITSRYNIDYSKNLDTTLDENTFKQIRFQPLIGKGVSPFLVFFFQAYCNSFLTYSIISNFVLAPSVSRNQRILNSNGSNLAGVLEYYKQNKPEVVDSINEILKRNIPTLDYVYTNHLGISNNYYFLVRERDGKDYLLNELSEGTDCFIALITAMVSSQFLEVPKNTKGILIIEEPEKNLHPQLMEEIISVAKSLTDKFQVIFTTHSTDLVAQLQTDDLILLDKKDNGTRMQRIKKTAELEAYLEEFSLDQIWLNNDLGGGTING